MPKHLPDLDNTVAHQTCPAGAVTTLTFLKPVDAPPRVKRQGRLDRSDRPRSRLL